MKLRRKEKSTSIAITTTSTWAMYTATKDSGKGPNLFGLIILASEPFSTYLQLSLWY